MKYRESTTKGKKRMAKYRSIDLFAGIGGIRIGFDNAFKDEIKTVYASEIDEYAVKTYSDNFDDDFEIVGDITKEDEKQIPRFDICLAGFPCQAFSIAGSHGGFNDDYHGRCRGTLFLDVIRICDYHKPKVIFCENVKGLTIHDNGRTFKIIKKAFEEIGYTLYDKVLNSKDFGVPQNRERIYLVCFRNDIDSSKFKFPTGTDSSKTIRDILDLEPISPKYYLSNTYVETLRRHKARHKAKGNGFGYEIRDLDGIAGTIVCGGMGRERNLIIDHRVHSMTPITHIKGEINKEDIRKMTPREWARLQGFPDTYELNLADTHLYKQFGNSVTVPVIEAIAKEIKKVLFERSMTMPRKEGAKPKLLRYCKAHVGEQISRETLKEIADNVGSWERSLRTLRDDGYVLEYDSTTKSYCFPYSEPVNEPKDNRYISTKLKSLVMIRDNSTCQMCGKTVKDDHIRVHIDHIVPLSWGGKTELDNLQVLCSNCNEGKKNYVESENPDLMAEVSKGKNAEERLRIYFEYYKNVPVDVDRLAVVARTREWTRALRYVRADYDMNIEYVPKNNKKNIEREYYIYHLVNDKDDETK